MSKETEKTVELLLLYLRVRLASGDVAGSQIVADEIAAVLKGETMKEIAGLQAVRTINPGGFILPCKRAHNEPGDNISLHTRFG